jgi:hypothetical protein
MVTASLCSVTLDCTSPDHIDRIIYKRYSSFYDLHQEVNICLSFSRRAYGRYLTRVYPTQFLSAKLDVTDLPPLPPKRSVCLPNINY